MPTYEYQCRACDQRVEVFQKITDDPLSTCEACGGALRKIFHAAGIIFKGSGFYVTDYKNKENGGSAGRNGSSNGSAASTESKSGESKTSAAPEKKETAPASKSE